MGSDELAALIEEARWQNPDARIAADRIYQARGRLRESRAILSPVLSATAATSLRDDPKSSPLSDTSLSADIYLDLDLNGRRRALAAIAGSNVAVAEYEREATLRAIEGAVASTFALRAVLVRRLELVSQSAARSAELERIIRIRLREGEASRLELGLQVLQQRQFVDDELQLKVALDATRTALATLVGREAPQYVAPAGRLETLQLPAAELAAPRELVLALPEVRAAEARIDAAGGSVRAARAAFLPSLAVGAVAGDPSSAYVGVSQLLAPVFGRARLKGQLATAQAEQREALETYRRVLLQALQQVEDAISLARRAGERETMLEAAVTEARVTARLAQSQYLEGDADLQRVVEVEQRLRDVEDALTLARAARLDAAITLYLAGAPRSDGDLAKFMR